MSKQGNISFFSAGRLFARFAAEQASPVALFAKAKKPVPSPHPDRKDGSWRTTATGKHYFVASDGQEFHGDDHPQNSTYRSVAVPVPSDVFQRLDIKPLRVTADYITLDRKHQDQFTGPEDAKSHVESVLKNPTHILPGDVEGHRLIVRRNSTDKAVALDVVFKGGAYRVQSAHVLTSGQLEAKLSKIPEGWKAEFYMPAGGSHTSGPMSHGEAPSSFWGGTAPFDADSTGNSIISDTFKVFSLFAKFAAEEAGLWGEATKLREARAKTNTAPTPTQRKSGRYAKGRFVWNGLKIAIENPLGSVREGTTKDGTPWRRRMTSDYGYFEDYKGFDGDELDVLIGPDLTSEAVFVVDQKNADGGFDESKVVIGTADIVEARDLYLANYQDCWELNIRNIFPMGLNDFKMWLEGGQALTDRGIQLALSAAHFAGKKPLETPHPNRTDGHWITENGAHVFVDKSGRKFPPGQHPQDKTHRNVTVSVHPKLFTRLGIDPAEVKADYVKLDQKHQDQFMGADDARQHVEHVMAAPTHVLPGGSDHSSEPGHVLLVRKNGGDKAAVLDMVISGAKPDTKKPGKMFGGRYNIRSAYTLNTGGLDVKLANAPAGWSADFSDTGSESGEVSSAGGSHTPDPASKTLRPNPAKVRTFAKVARRQLCLGGTVPSDTDSTDDTSIISLPFVAFSLYARFLKEQGGKKPSRKAIEEARRQHCNASDSFCPDCGAVYEWADAEERGEEAGSCNRCGSHNEPVDGKLALEGDFFADFSRADFTHSQFVNVPALLSRTGNYTDKGIHLTPADFDRAAASVSPAAPVKMNMAHLRRGSVLDDAGLGEIHRTWRQDQELWGEIAVPQWLASLARERGLKLPVSAEWDIKTKTLRGCAWERTPRIEDARALLS